MSLLDSPVACSVQRITKLQHQLILGCHLLDTRLQTWRQKTLCWDENVDKAANFDDPACHIVVSNSNEKSKHLYAIMHSCKYLLMKDMVLSWTWKAYNIFIDHHICWAKRALIRHEVVACGVVTPIEAGPTPRPTVGAAVALAPRDSHTPSSSAQTHLGTRQTSGDAANVSSTELPAGRTLVGLSLETKFGVGVWFLATLFGEQDILNLRLQLYCLLCS